MIQKFTSVGFNLLRTVGAVLVVLCMAAPAYSVRSGEKISPDRWSGVPAFSIDGKLVVVDFPAMTPIKSKRKDGSIDTSYSLSSEKEQTLILDRQDSFALLCSIPAQLWTPTWSPKGNAFIAQRRAILGQSEADTHAYVYDALTGKVLRTLNVPYLTQFSWSPDGSLLAGANRKGVHIWNAAWKHETSLPGLIKATRPVWSPDGKHIAAAGQTSSEKASLMIFNASDYTPKWTRQCDDGVGDIAWSPDGTRLAYSLADHNVHILRFPEMTEILKIRGNDRFPSQLAWAPDGKHLFLSDEWFTAVCDSQTGKYLCYVQFDEPSIPVITPDGKTLVLSNRYGGAKLVGINLPPNSDEPVFADGKSGNPWADQKLPKTIEECFEALPKMFRPADLEEFKRTSEENLLMYTAGPGLGMQLRNMWVLRGRNDLTRYFNGLGVSSGRAMSDIILTSFWRHLNGKPIELEKQCAAYKNYPY